MKFEKHIIKKCCGKKSTLFKIDRPLTKEIMNYFISLGYKESPSLLKSGVLYIHNLDFIITGPIGSDRLEVKCKVQDCTEKLKELEDILLNMS